MDTLFNSELTAIGLLWIVIHLFGLFAAWMVRMHSHSRFELLAQGGFFTALLAVASTIVVGHLWCLEFWPLSAITLALMVVLSILDLGSTDSHYPHPDS